MTYDLFISYSRRDDKQGRVRALKEQIEADFSSFAKEELRCFFDIEDIASMEDWRHRILEALRDANLLLLVLSPAYLDSPYCEWEIVEFLKYEHSRSVGGQGVTPVYFVEIPGLDEPGFEQRAASWVARVRRRNQVDLRPWFDEGVAALKKADVRHRLADLEHSLHTRLSKLRRLREAPGNLPALNPRFVGREAEMQRLHEAAGLGRFGVLTAVQGMGGVGKTALAIQYAYAYADFYPGGRWLIGCAGESDIASALSRLHIDLGITLDEAEKHDDALAARRVLAELERRATEGATARTREQDPPLPKALLLFDNVNDPALLQSPQADLLTGRHWLHVLATTRSDTQDFGNNPEHLTVLSIDDLPDDDGLRLIESYQPSGLFTAPLERDAALALVKLLGGFTLAVEIVAVYLGEHERRVTCAAFLERMKKEGLGEFDDISRSTKGGIRHGHKLIGATLNPTLDLLTGQQRLVLSIGALLPPDSIPLPWLRALAAEDYPELGRDAGPGYDDPWLSLINRLLGLRLVQTASLDHDGRTPRLLRMHRFIGELARYTEAIAETLSDRLTDQLKLRCNELEESWHVHQWEVPPLVAYANNLLENGSSRAPKFVRSLCQWLPRYDDGRDSEPMLRLCLAQLEQSPSDDPLDLSVTLSNLGWALSCLGRYREAEPVLRRALEIDERTEPLNEHAIAVRCNQLNGCLRQQRKLAEAEPFCRRALEFTERELGDEDPFTLRCRSSLAGLLDQKGDYAGAEVIFRDVLEATERVMGAEHPETLARLSNLANCLQHLGDYSGAEPLYRRALEVESRVFGPEHPYTLTSVYNLGTLMENTGKHTDAERLHRRGLEGRERFLGPSHPETLDSVRSLADVFRAKGDFDAAEPLYRRTLEARERLLGSEHPDTLVSLACVGVLLYEKENYVGAEPLLRRALESIERVLGPRHRDTLNSMVNLANVCEKTGRLEEACALRLLRIERLAANSDTPTPPGGINGY